MENVGHAGHLGAVASTMQAIPPCWEVQQVTPALGWYSVSGTTPPKVELPQPLSSRAVSKATNGRSLMAPTCTAQRGPVAAPFRSDTRDAVNR